MRRQNLDREIDALEQFIPRTAAELVRSTSSNWFNTRLQCRWCYPMAERLPKPDWRMLQRRMSAVSVVSCADGTMSINPVWRRSWIQNARGPGLFTRMCSAAELERLINQRLKRKASNG